MKTYIFQYNTDGYLSPLPVSQFEIRAQSENNALAAGVREIGATRGAITEAKRLGGRVFIGMASCNRPKFAWIERSDA